jgi:chaperone modulatory protein CbpM
LIVDTTNADSGVFTLCEICERGERHEGSVTKPVNHDILSLIKEHHCPLDWQLDAIALTRLQRALRLQQNLALNFPGLLNLLNEVQQMCREMSRLNQCFLPLSEEWTT